MTTPERIHGRAINQPAVGAARIRRIKLPGKLWRIGIAADHGGYDLKEYLAGKLREDGQEVTDFGDGRAKEDDDYPDFVVPLARAVAAGTVARGIAIWDSGVGACSLTQI